MRLRFGSGLGDAVGGMMAFHVLLKFIAGTLLFFTLIIFCWILFDGACEVGGNLPWN